MAARFPAQLFPHFYLDGPPETGLKHHYHGWGSYGAVISAARCEVEAGTVCGFKAQRKMEGEMWIPVEPAVTPLLPPHPAGRIPSGPPYSPDDFPEHMRHFYVHHCMDSFSTMGRLLGEHFSFHNKARKDCISMGRMKNVIQGLKYKKCDLQHTTGHVQRYRHLLEDVLCDIPSTLLAELLHEELAFQREQEQFCVDTSGGALGYLPLQDFEGQREACLIYPRGKALDSLAFHRVVLEYDGPSVDLRNEPLEYELNGAVRQISTAQVANEGQVGVRSDHFCAAWVIKVGERPRPLDVVQLKERCTCLNVSPHVNGELVVASESGAAYLWTVGKRPQMFRDENANMYFNAKSAWRWCEFSAHPRVLVFADRTGAELTDSRSRDASHTLFRIGKTAGCRSGERVILSKYVGEVHDYHHLITTQFSAYVMDERMPSIPALKWEHMMESPPCFAHVLPALGPSATSKILLGAQRAQETVLLQYSGGHEEACQADGPVQKLRSPSESLKLHLLPHMRHKVEKRLAVPAAGLTATQSDGFLTVFQFTEAGDLFSQVLRLHSETSAAHPGSSAPSCNMHTVDHPSALPEPAEEPRREPAAPSDEELSFDADFERERLQRMLSQIEVVFSYGPDGPQAAGAEEGISCGPAPVPETPVRPAQISLARPARPEGPETASAELTLLWEKWLEPLLTDGTRKRRTLKHRQVKTSDVMKFKGRRRVQLEVERFRSLRNSLTDAMKNKKLLVHGGTCLPPLQVTPVPDLVIASDWPDDLSQRLSASWEGGWRTWWEEKLGLNRDSKIQALRRKRRMEKRGRARNRVALSESFTSSVSYQDGLSGWSSATSQYLGSDSESQNYPSAVENDPLSEPETQGSSAVTEWRGSPHTSQWLEQDRASSIPRPQTQQGLQRKVSNSERGSVISPLLVLEEALSLQDGPSVQQWQQQDYLRSLFSIPEPSRDPGDLPLVSSGAASLQRSGLPSASQRPSRPRPSSQASQPQRKKSRMGF